MIEWTVSKEDMNLILAITLRAERMGIAGKPQRMRALMDLTACHANGTPLRLPDLLHAADGDFIHDIAGICAHMNRETGQLQDCFLPRYAAKGE